MRSKKTDRGMTLFELLFDVTIILVLTAISLPSLTAMALSFKLSGDARDLADELMLARMRASSNASPARLNANLTTGTFQLELCTKSNCTTGLHADTVDGTQNLNPGISFGYGSLTSPANAQPLSSYAVPCLDSTGNPITNTACVIFNSRGIPVDSAGTLYGNYALYLTNGYGHYAVTVELGGTVSLYKFDGSNWYLL